MNVQSPIGYPPPTLVRKRSGLFRLRTLTILLVGVGLAIGGYAVTRRFQTQEAAPPQAEPARRPAKPAPPVVAPVDTPAAALPDTAAAPPVTVETPDDAAKVDKPVDARVANSWYYVPRLGDGPGAIYSKTGGQWSYAFACTTRTKMIEIIAVGTGSPGNFEQQAIAVGTAKLLMDASYSPDGGGTISATVPAADPFFSALDGKAPMEIQLVADRKTVVPVGPAVARLVATCRGRG